MVKDVNILEKYIQYLPEGKTRLVMLVELSKSGGLTALVHVVPERLGDFLNNPVGRFATIHWNPIPVEDFV